MREIKIKGVYKHFKWDQYIVEDVAIHSETKEKYVVYRWLYWNNELYIRPLDHEKYPNVTQKYRFQEQKIESVNK